MIRTLGILFVISAGMVWSSVAQESHPKATDQTAKLPGARPEINAAEYPSLQAAFDAIPSEGGVVRIPPGTFEISEPLILSRGDVLIEGAGTATHIKNINTDGKPALLVAHSDGEKVKSADRLWRVMLSKFRITGQEKSGHGIEAVLVNEIFLHGVTVSYHGGDGIRLDRCYEDPRVSSCLITYNKGTGLDLPGCHDIVVSGNQFEENQDAVHCFDAYNLCMTGNCVDDHLGDGVVIENTYGSVISGNMIEECEKRAIVLARDCYGITLSANVIAHNGGGIDLVDAHGCAVSANTFPLLKTPIKPKDGSEPTLVNTGCLRIGPDSGRITVTGNSFSDSYIGEGAVRRKVNDQLSGGLVLEGTRDVNISGNTFSSVPKAVELRGEKSENIHFNDNLLIDAPSDLAQE
ncbi:right-handed parallel beta-helix repeat-containing protein [Rubinisphaera margarita]|uniref:right-handed parallel beta-helix repeat-containing protein n=1 Tax=Rubinisphaera margarita TaxID=2909586 RepID=UPI001EE9935A|nr:right-handed parallel beta-helix repeat-containing protein [Rubinisphaera margarita]MCG6156583.1 right-handed parallel beta-helix repeat-containing protein [Rubinisphaera margarita]